MTTTTWVILVIANIPIYFGFAWLLFRSWENFFDAIRFWFTPDAWSFIQGEFLADWYAEAKLGLWVAACGACIAAEAYALEKLLTHTEGAVGPTKYHPALRFHHNLNIWIRPCLFILRAFSTSAPVE